MDNFQRLIIETERKANKQFLNMLEYDICLYKKTTRNDKKLKLLYIMQERITESINRILDYIK
jgi:hypothetical protein